MPKEFNFLSQLTGSFGRAGATDDPSSSTNAIADAEGALRVPADYRSTYEYLGAWAIAADVFRHIAREEVGDDDHQHRDPERLAADAAVEAVEKIGPIHRRDADFNPGAAR